MSNERQARRRRERTVVAGAAISALLATAACSGSDDGPADTRLTAALGEVTYTDRTPEGLVFVDAAEANRLLDADEERFDALATLGTPLLGEYVLPDHRFGLDRENAETAVSVGFA